MIVFCPNCGLDVHDAEYCPNCGSDILQKRLEKRVIKDVTSLNTYSAGTNQNSPIIDFQKPSKSHKYSQYYVNELKSPWIGFFSSIFIPGVGHWYAGKKSDALLIFLILGPLILLGLLLLSAGSAIIVFIIPVNIVIGERAYSHVKRYNWFVLAHNLPPPPDP